ncbi:MAG: UDP-N-acetylmuramoyl-tripeptide--D-alanyl-D-alanine ligase [Candidatus Rokubacteria bacterium]|nr:UDP-N-acetylmuramoyl-tripeptide--D-alanyl-D-alanine ligase [Candidatus Rokubacteria bacterium]
MPTLTVQDVVRATQGALVVGDLGIPLTGVSIDSRTLGVGEAFFAIRGHRVDGHDFVADAASRGTACLVVHTVPDPIPAGVPLVLVEDTTRALGRLGAWHRSRFDIPVVAVTGSNGKTTTKEMIAAVLGVSFKVLKPEASFNNQWGLPLTLLKLTPEHEALVVEIGTNQRGEIAYLSGLAAPTVGVVTTVAAVHTEFLGSLDGVREEKCDLVRAVPPEGRVVLNGDDRLVAGMARDARAPVLTYGRAATADVRAVGEVTEGPDGLRVTLETGGARQAVTLAFAGVHNVTNALAAAAAGRALGLDLPDIARGLEAARPVTGRCVWREAGDVRILDDTYNANPASVKAALETAAAHRGERRLVVVLGDMLELGAAAEEAHREVGRQVAASGAAELVGLGKHVRLAVEEARERGLGEAQHTTTFEDTVAHLLKRIVPGDLVLVKGSRGMRMERVADALAARLARPGQR